MHNLIPKAICLKNSFSLLLSAKELYGNYLRVISFYLKKYDSNIQFLRKKVALKNNSFEMDSFPINSFMTEAPIL